MLRIKIDAKFKHIVVLQQYQKWLQNSFEKREACKLYIEAIKVQGVGGLKNRIHMENLTLSF